MTEVGSPKHSVVCHTPARSRRRVLHVVSSMNRGGIENWLMHVLRNIDRNRVEIDFAVQHPAAGVYDDEIRALGSKIYTYAAVSDPLRFALSFDRLLREHGPYDVVHSHLYFFSGLVLLLARRHGVPVRIAHGHTGSRRRGNGLVRRTYERVARQLIFHHATVGLANSSVAAAALFGNDWQTDPRWSVLWYGFDFTPFEHVVTPAEARQALGLPLHRLIIGHVGRFDPVKNHRFLVDIFQAVLQRGVDAHLVLAGSGPLFDQVCASLRERGLESRCALLGDRSDIPTVLGAMDVMVFPSRVEGFGIAVLEAQAAGVPTLASAAVPTDVDVVPELVRHLPLDAGIDRWAEAALDLATRPRMPRMEALARLASSPFGIHRCLERLYAIYEGKER